MATTNTTPDLENISMEDLRKLAEEEARKQSTTATVATEEAEAAPSEEAEEEEEQPAPRSFVAERSFDLGDGAGAQIFRGKGATREEALEDLANKQIEAQKNATRRIKELKAAKPQPQEPTITKEQEALLAAELLQTPSAAFEKMLKAHGVSLDEVKQAAEYTKAQKAANAKKSTADAFVAANPEYADTPHNGKLVNKWCELHNDFSLEGMNKAFQDLSESGLLQAKGEEAGHRQEEDKSATRIEPKTEVTPSRVTKKASGLSTHRRTPVAMSAEPSEDDMYAMPIDELRKRATAQLTGR